MLVCCSPLTTGVMIFRCFAPVCMLYVSLIIGMVYLPICLWALSTPPRYASPRLSPISEVSTVTLRYSADHLIPVYESAEIGPYLARRRMEELHDPTLITPKERIHSRFSSYLYPQHQPMYWRVPPGSYLTPWVRKFRLRKFGLVP